LNKKRIKEFKALINISQLFKAKISLDKYLFIHITNVSNNNLDYLFEYIEKYHFKIKESCNICIIIDLESIKIQDLIEKEYNYQLPSNQLFNSVSKLIRKANSWNQMNDSIYFNEGV